MVKFVADENFNGYILNGVRERMPLFDCIRIQDIGLEGASDPQVLEWAAAQNRILLTHDAKTMPDFAYQRVGNEQAMVGVVLIRRKVPIGVAIDELVILIECSEEGDWEGLVVELPLTP